MKQPEFTELAAAAAVAAHRNFRAAAAEIGMSASALSHAISSLEAKLGIRLFNRTTRSVSLTQAGMQFLARIEPAMREIRTATAEANEQRDNPAGLIRINAAEVAAEQVLGPVVLEFSRRFPQMQVEIVTEGRLVDIVESGFDAGVRLAGLIPLDMIAVPIGSDQRHLVVGAPSYFEGRTRPQVPADLKDHVGIRMRLPGGSIYRWEFERRGTQLTVDVSGPLTFDSPRLILQAALGGAGLAYVHEWSARGDIAAGRLDPVLTDWTPAYPGLCLYYPSHRNISAGLRAFIGFLRQVSAGREPFPA